VLSRFTLVVDGFEVPYAVAGAGTRALVCVNGRQQTMAGWRALLKRTGTTSWRTVVFDFPRQRHIGTSAEHPGLSTEQQVAILSAVVDRVSPDAPVALMGGSWGALLAAAYASHQPDRVSKLLLCSFDSRPTVKLRELAEQPRTTTDDGRADAVASLFLCQFADNLPSSRPTGRRAPFRNCYPEELRQMYEHGPMLTGDADVDAMFDLRRINVETVVINGQMHSLIDHATYLRVLCAPVDQPAQLAARA
jgi:pimeloyl-ACP methyl ester carboxylesterase